MGAGRPVRRRRRARHPAPALRALHHQGALRPRLPELHRAVQRAAEPGHGASWTARRCRSRRATSSSSPSELDAHGVDALRLTMAFAGPPEDDIDWADVSPVGVGEVPRARVAHLGRGDVEPRRRVEDGRRRRCAASPTASSPTRRRSSRRSSSTSSSRASWSSSTRPARRSTPAPGRRMPRCARPSEVTAMVLDLFAPYTAEDMWAAARLRAERRARAVAQGRPDAARRGVGHRDRAGRRQGARPARGVAEDLGRRARGARSGVGRRVARAIGEREIVNVIVRAPRIVNIATRA